MTAQLAEGFKLGSIYWSFLFRFWWLLEEPFGLLWKAAHLFAVFLAAFLATGFFVGFLATDFLVAGFLTAGFVVESSLVFVLVGLLAFLAAGFLAAGFFFGSLVAGFFFGSLAAGFFLLRTLSFGLGAFLATSESLYDPEAPVPLVCTSSLAVSIFLSAVLTWTPALSPTL